MAYTFNPFTGNLDEVGAGGAVTPGGSNTEVQFNDGGSLGGDDGLTFNKTTNELTVGASTGDGGSAKVYGDINLDDGGASTTTVQCVTPTANRTISFPDATGTIALVAGSNQAVQYNSAGTNAGDSGLLYDATSGSLTVGGKTVNTNAPVLNLSQTWSNPSVAYTALKLNVSGLGASTSNLLDLQVGGTSQFKITSTGLIKAEGQGVLPGGTESGLHLGTTRYFALRSANTTGTSVYIQNSSASNAVASLQVIGTSDAARSGSGQIFTTGRCIFTSSQNTTEQENGTNAQTFRLYNTWANSGVDFERTSITRDSSGLVIDAQKGGTGADPTNLLDVKLGGTSYFSTASSGSTTISGPNTVNSTALILKEGFNGISNTYVYFRNYLSQNVASISAIPGRFRFFVNDSAGGTSREMFNLIGSGRRMLLNQDLSLEWRDTAGDSWSAAGTADTALARDSAGVVKITNGSTGTGYLRQVPIPVASLPTAAAGNAGTRIFVSDSNVAAATNFGEPVANGGSNVVPVYSDGSTWRIG
jgi:hypothetical protein